MSNVYCHEHRAVVVVTGGDRLTLLQGLITADVVGLAEGFAAYGALLTPQGRFLHDFLIFKTAEALFFNVETARADDFIMRLKRYKLRADVTFKVDEALRLMSEQVSTASPQDPRHAALGFVSLKPAQPTTWLDYEETRIRAAAPDGSRDMIVEDSLLLDYGVDTLNGIAFTKGCYVGQEITARMKYKAQPKKAFMSIELLSGGFPPVGAALDDIGIMGSHQGSWGAALLKIDHAQPGAVHTLTDGLSFRLHAPLSTHQSRQ
ncbi:MAG: YgfZ/GcvT domain-containing protein [Holosporales bacterium]|jgi:folate-binding protein YgfZ